MERSITACRVLEASGVARERLRAGGRVEVAVGVEIKRLITVGRVGDAGSVG